MSPEPGQPAALPTISLKGQGIARVPSDATAAQVTRRDRAREETLAEIKSAARKLLVEQGIPGVQLRAVAREVGMTAPGLYRYVDSLEALIEMICADCFDELCTSMEAARDAVPSDQHMERMKATSRAFRSWSVSNPSEFSLIFGTPARGPFNPEDPTAAEMGADRFGSIFSALFLELWMSTPFKIAAEQDLSPELVAHMNPLRTWICDILNADIPVGAMVAFLEAWIRLHGAVTLETFGHLRWAFATGDGSPLFERTLDEIGASWAVPPDA